jgi:hypothetical protein
MSQGLIAYDNMAMFIYVSCGSLLLPPSAWSLLLLSISSEIVCDSKRKPLLIGRLC